MERKPNKNEALEALDFIINVLKEHEKDLDRLVSQLSIITESLGETGEITGKIEKIEDRITNLQGEISGMVRKIDAPRESTTVSVRQSSPVAIQCAQWEDFKTMATGAEAVSFILKEENTFQAEALKNGKIISYTGTFPENNQLLKLWLSSELCVKKTEVFEGTVKVN
jgi:hypothetical protein